MWGFAISLVPSLGDDAGSGEGGGAGGAGRGGTGRG